MSKTVKVPFNDLYLQHLSLGDELHEAIERVIRDSAFIRGPDVVEFEHRYARLVGAKHCVSCANGTDALYIAMKALGAGPGDEVIVPAMSWISTSETVSQTGATVVFCDIDPVTNTIDTNLISSKITDRTVGIIPVHLYGFPADMHTIKEIADKSGLWIIEDCAQAHLAKIAGEMVGSFGVAATYSFYPGKNLGALGDAGAITTNDLNLARTMSMFARHGGLSKGEHEIEGINSRLDGLQAAILNLKIEKLATWTMRRAEIAAEYSTRMAGLPIGLPPSKTSYEPVWHLYVICTEQRNALRSYLTERKIQTVLNYPRALPFLPCYSDRKFSKYDFPVAYRLQNECISIPIFPELTEEQYLYVSDSVRAFFDRNE